MMRAWPSALIGLIWISWFLSWFLFWRVTTKSAKHVRERESFVSRALYLVPMLSSAVLLAWRLPGWLGERWIGGGWTRYWLGVSLVIAGLAFAVWARLVLGDNWSAAVSIKVGHELIRTGPYRSVRHPIYTGALTALLGTALASGRAQGLLAIVIAAAALWHKLRIEERWMGQQFGQQYAEYRRTSWALLPFVL